MAVAAQCGAGFLPEVVVVHFDALFEFPAQFGLAAVGDTEGGEAEGGGEVLQGGGHELLGAQAVELFGEAAHGVFGFAAGGALHGGGEQAGTGEGEGGGVEAAAVFVGEGERPHAFVGADAVAVEDEGEAV